MLGDVAWAGERRRRIREDQRIMIGRSCSPSSTEMLPTEESNRLASYWYLSDSEKDDLWVRGSHINGDALLAELMRAPTDDELREMTVEWALSLWTTEDGEVFHYYDKGA